MPLFFGRSQTVYTVCTVYVPLFQGGTPAQRMQMQQAQQQERMQQAPSFLYKVGFSLTEDNETVFALIIATCRPFGLLNMQVDLFRAKPRARQAPF